MSLVVAIAVRQFLIASVLAIVPLTAAHGQTNTKPNSAVYDVKYVHGWQIKINHRLVAEDNRAMDVPLRILNQQLAAIEKVVPAAAVKRLKEVTLWFNPEYPGVRPGAEYHPGQDWLIEQGRNPDMVKGVEFTNVRIFAHEYTRMPCFVLHELAHSYHDRVLGFENAEIEKAYNAARASGKYDKVARHNGEGRPDTVDKAYAMSNAREYFAESTEAFFGQNDFYPFNRSELLAVDPGIATVLQNVWFRSAHSSGKAR